METFIAAAVLAAVHLGSWRLFVPREPRSRFLSAAGGISIAYVFLHLLPGIAEAPLPPIFPGRLEAPGFVLALLGLVGFYGLMKAAQRSAGNTEEDGASSEVFWLHIVIFAAYYFVVGYLVNSGEHDSLMLFTLALTLHFAVVDYGLEADHREPYRRKGRWILAAAVIAGWALSVTTEVSQSTVELISAVLGGGIILNTMKEELPDERRSRFLPFAAGALGYGALMLII